LPMASHRCETRTSGLCRAVLFGCRGRRFVSFGLVGPEGESMERAQHSQENPGRGAITIRHTREAGTLIEVGGAPPGVGRRDSQGTSHRAAGPCAAGPCPPRLSWCNPP
jgi:hypothetical protein